MRIACCLSGLVALSIACTPPAATDDAAARMTVTGRTADGATNLRIQTGAGRAFDLAVRRDDTVAATGEPTSIDVVAEVPGVAVVVADRYPSLPGGLSYCQAGEERFLRVIAIAADSVRETLVTKIASCRQNIELAERGVEWDAPTTTLRIHWLSGPDGTSEVRTIRIDGRGAVDTRG